MSFEEIKKVNLPDICVVPDSDMKAFNDAEKEIFNIIDQNSILTKNKNLKKIQGYLQIALNICISNANDSSLIKKYENSTNAIKKEFGSIPNVNPQSSGAPINSLISNYIKIVSDYNNIIKNINGLSNEAKKAASENKKITEIVSMLFAGAHGIEALCSSRQSTWDRRLSNTKELLSRSQQSLKIALKELEWEKCNQKLNVVIKEKVRFEEDEKNGDEYKISPQDVATHKKLLSQFGNNSIEYRKWWIWYYFLLCKATTDIKNQLIDFNHGKTSSITPENVKRAISGLSYTSIKYLIDNVPGPDFLSSNTLFHLRVYEADPYLGKLIYNNNNGELQAFKISIQSLAKDLKKELEKRKVLINSGIDKIKPTNDFIENLLSVLRKCVKNSKAPFPNSLSTSLSQYVGGGKNVSSNNINAVFRNTLNILEKGDFGKYFVPETYAKVCHHVRIITKAFKEENNSNNVITKTSEDQNVVRGMNYTGLCAMFKNGGYKIPATRNQFSESTANDINNSKPTIFDRAPLSTAMSNNVGDAFSMGKVILKIFVPKGTRSVDVPKNVRASNAMFENELLLPPGTKLKVEKCYISKDKCITVVTNVVN